MSHEEHRYWFRQSFIVFSTCLQSLSNGIMLAFPSVLNPAIMDPKSNGIIATPSEASWLASVPGMTGIIGFLTLAPLMQIYGRKPLHFIKSLVVAIAWLIFYYAESLPALFVARALQGVSIGGIFLNMIIIGEYVNPNRRGYFTTIQKFALSAGTLICHLMAVWFDWKQISATAGLIAVLSAFVTLLWPESPFFLAYRGRFDECENSFHWLNGTLARNSELQELIKEQKERREIKKSKINNSTKKILQQLVYPEFLKSIMIVALLIVLMDLTGRNYFKAYVVQIMMELNLEKSTSVYISVGSDLSVLMALLIGCMTIQYYSRRILLFSFGAITGICLYCISLILYLKSSNIVAVFPWLAPGLILIINFVVHIGVVPVCFVVMGEIFPLEYKGLGSCLSGFVFTSSFGIILKLTPVMIERIRLEGTYAVYATGLTISFVVLYFILPETKDKTLLAIEHNLKGTEDIKQIESLLKPV